ncbi:MAG TPA: MBL fold metallo-hydrolase, partial [Solirubrobacteraceae bacterium]
ITHHHSDHMTDVADLMITRWVRNGAMPFPIVAPDGPAANLLARLMPFWEDDINVRQTHGRRENRPEVEVHAFAAGEDPVVVWERGSVRVTSVAVNHEPVVPAVGYRVDASEGSITISGDTRVSPALMRLADGSDILLHEAMRSEPVLSAGLDHVAAYHSDTQELGRAVAGLDIKTLVLTHLEPSPSDRAAAARFAEEVHRGGFEGNVVVAQDLVTVDHRGGVYW